MSPLRFFTFPRPIDYLIVLRLVYSQWPIGHRGPISNFQPLIFPHPLLSSLFSSINCYVFTMANATPNLARCHQPFTFSLIRGFPLFRPTLYRFFCQLWHWCVHCYPSSPKLYSCTICTLQIASNFVICCRINSSVVFAAVPPSVAHRASGSLSARDFHGSRDFSEEYSCKAVYRNVLAKTRCQRAVGDHFSEREKWSSLWRHLRRVRLLWCVFSKDSTPAIPRRVRCNLHATQM